MGVKEIRPVGTVEEAISLKNMVSDSILIGERHGKKCDGFDYGNSPSTIPGDKVKGKTIIHTFDKARQDIFPEEDFWMCVKYNQFPFVIRIEKDENGFIALYFLQQFCQVKIIRIKLFRITVIFSVIK